MTRLCRIHPYPGMIADELATAIADEYVRKGTRVLDPFCGTGRTLVATAQQGGVAVGVDINPLAVIVSRAKVSIPNRALLDGLRDRVNSDALRYPETEYGFEEGRIARWFSRKAKRQLSGLIQFINGLQLPNAELALVASILSATARDVSFCRKDQWKLHRMSARDRSVFRPCAWRIFLNRLDYVIREIARLPSLSGKCRVISGDARVLQPILPGDTFDLVFTSPPYGDSRTTVQYGGISRLCLGVIRHLAGLPIEFCATRNIERDCLGGISKVSYEDLPFDLRRYWQGEDVSKARARTISFLRDLLTCCRQLSPFVRRNGHAIFVVARRTVGGDQLRLDKFVKETLSESGFDLKSCRKRRIAGKMTPYRIDRLGNTGKPAPFSPHVSTMREEYVLVFRHR